MNKMDVAAATSFQRKTQKTYSNYLVRCLPASINNIY